MKAAPPKSSASASKHSSIASSTWTPPKRHLVSLTNTVVYSHFSLKARLRLGTIRLVTLLVLVLAGLNLHRAIEQTFFGVQEHALSRSPKSAIFSSTASPPANSPPTPSAAPPEVAALQSKLDILDQQLRGARQDVVAMQANIEQLFERMEYVVLLFDRSPKLLIADRPAKRLLQRPQAERIGRSVTELFPASTPIGSAIETALQFSKPLTDFLVTHAQLRFLLSLNSSDGRLLVTLRDAKSRQLLASHLDLSAHLASINRITGGGAHESLPSTPSPSITTRLTRVVKGVLGFTRPVEVRLESLDLVAPRRRSRHPNHRPPQHPPGLCPHRPRPARTPSTPSKPCPPAVPSSSAWSPPIPLLRWKCQLKATAYATSSARISSSFTSRPKGVAAESAWLPRFRPYNSWQGPSTLPANLASAPPSLSPSLPKR